MTVTLVIQDFEFLSQSGAYGGTRFLSPQSELMLISLYQYASLYRWVNAGGQPLTDEQKDTIDNWTSTARAELMTSALVGTVQWSMVNPANAPDNLLLADGSIINDYDYPELAQVLGSEWLVSPSPPGVIQFRLPNLIDAYVQGASSGNMQTRVGANNVTLTTAQIPNHSHTYTRPFVQTVTYTPGPGPATFVSVFNTATSTAGGDQPHENRPLSQRLYPYVVAR